MHIGNGYDNWVTTGGSRTCSCCGARYFASDGGCTDCADAYAEWEAEALDGLTDANIQALVEIGEFHQVGHRPMWLKGETLWESGLDAEDAAERLAGILMEAFKQAS